MKPLRLSKKSNWSALIAVLFAVFVPATGCTASKEMVSTGGKGIDNKILRFRIVPRTADQMAAFYEGRGLSPAAIKSIRRDCFFTVIMKNRSKDILWANLNQWKFEDERGQPVVRRDREHWKHEWRRIKLPRSYQSTFGWTLFPEKRDLRHDEPVGGNIVLARTNKKVKVTAIFDVGPREGRGGKVTIVWEGLRCAQE